MHKSNVVFIVLLFVAALFPSRQAQPQKAENSAADASSDQDQQKTKAPALPRGKKLILKDGSFQLVREYQIQGDRVRYYSIDSSDWEEIPASLVDWDSTKKMEAEEAQRDAGVVAQVKKREDERGAEPLDIDASIEAAPGVFLPPGPGPFAFDGKAAIAMKQADMTSTLSKTKALERVLVPIPIIPSRHTISINGTRAKLRVRYAQPEFYMRTSDGTEPELEFVRAKVHGDSRQIEKVDEILGEQAATGETFPVQRWVLAPGVFRFTMGQPLNPGEYAMVQTFKTDAGMSMYIWDFGVEAATGPGAPKLK
jgi:hypothetical protein